MQPFGHNNLSCAFDQHDGYHAPSIDEMNT